ncbi:MAG: glutathione S-transferase family protein [Actinomycetota bacterium]
MQLYWGSGSPFAWRAMLGLVIKKQPFESTRLELSRAGLKTPEYLAINPRGKVPTLVDGDTVVTESMAILAYLDAKFPEPALFGSSPIERARVMQKISEHNAYIIDKAMPVVRMFFSGKAKDEPEALREGSDKLIEELKIHDQELASGGPWLAGEHLSAADIVMYPSWQMLRRALFKPVASQVEHGLASLSEIFPALHAWFERFDRVDGVDSTYPPHWRES